MSATTAAESAVRRVRALAVRGRRPGDAASCSRRSAATEGTSKGRHAWHSLWGWETVFGIALVVTVASVALTAEATVAARGAALAGVAVLTVAYVLLGRRVITDDDDEVGPRALVYWVLVVAVFTAAALAVPSTSFGLFALCPQAFMTLRMRQAVVVVLALNLAPAAWFLFRPGMTPGQMVMSAGSTAMIIALTLVNGAWISRIIQQSAERADLIAELESSRAEVARLSAERGALAERERLAGEIHDTLAQGLSSILMLVQAAQAQPDPSRHLDLAVRTARENLAEARGLIEALTPPPLDGSTLEEALRRVTARLGEEAGIRTSFTVAGGSRPLAPGVEVVLLRAAQEGLANVRKHAEASSAAVTLEYGPSHVTLRVADDGAGFRTGLPAGSAPGAGHGYGLRAMRSRVEQEGGTFAVETAPGRGAALTVTLPTPAHAP